MLSETEYEDGDQQETELELSCGAPDGRVYPVPKSVADKAWIEDKRSRGELMSGRSELVLPTGTQINPDTQELVMNGPPGLLNNPGLNTRRLGEDRHRHLAVTGTKTVLAVKVVAANAEFTAATESGLSDSVF